SSSRRRQRSCTCGGGPSANLAGGPAATTIAAIWRSTGNTSHAGRRSWHSGCGPGAAASDNIHHRPVRIAIDARKLHDYGIGTHVRNLVYWLSKQDDPTTTYVLLCRREDAEF